MFVPACCCQLTSWSYTDPGNLERSRLKLLNVVMETHMANTIDLWPVMWPCPPAISPSLTHQLPAAPGIGWLATPASGYFWRDCMYSCVTFSMRYYLFKFEGIVFLSITRAVIDYTDSLCLIEHWVWISLHHTHIPILNWFAISARGTARRC